MSDAQLSLLLRVLLAVVGVVFLIWAYRKTYRLPAFIRIVLALYLGAIMLWALFGPEF